MWTSSRLCNKPQRGGGIQMLHLPRNMPQCCFGQLRGGLLPGKRAPLLSSPTYVHFTPLKQQKKTKKTQKECAERTFPNKTFQPNPFVRRAVLKIPITCTRQAEAKEKVRAPPTLVPSTPSSQRTFHKQSNTFYIGAVHSKPFLLRLEGNHRRVGG